jgi:mannose-1-phosphate guanylyltransferase/mannose-6-phosphate isomerase
MKALVLAGGSGTRLWPLSRKNYPKQFLKLNGKDSLLRQTVGRLLNVLARDEIIVMTSEEYRFYVRSEIKEISHVILERQGRNTAPAIALGIKYCTEKLGCDGEEVVLVAPADHVIRPVDRFVEYLKLAVKVARQGHIVTFGVKPDRPETGYGYIKAGAGGAVSTEQTNRIDQTDRIDQKSVASDKRSVISGRVTQRNHINEKDEINQTYLPVEAFIEKPDAATATGYLDVGNYYWNSGMFAFSIKTMTEELRKHAPAIGGMLGRSFDEMNNQFHEMPEISIDYAVMEKSERVALLPMDLYWNDIGSWDSLYDLLRRDANGNAAVGDVVAIDTRNCLLFGNKRLLSTIGLEDCLVVETEDAVLIAKKGETAKVREVVNRLKESQRKEAIEHVTTYRPWGSYTILEQGPRYKIKRVVVNPGEKISLQKHSHRSEHWIVVSGTAKIAIGDQEIFVHENESAYVPKSTLHRLENAGKIPVEIIEVQNGEYLEEDDIERFSDDYGR